MAFPKGRSTVLLKLPKSTTLCYGATPHPPVPLQSCWTGPVTSRSHNAPHSSPSQSLCLADTRDWTHLGASKGTPFAARDPNHTPTNTSHGSVDGTPQVPVKGQTWKTPNSGTSNIRVTMWCVRSVTNHIEPKHLLGPFDQSKLQTKHRSWPRRNTRLRPLGTCLQHSNSVVLLH